MRRSRQLGWLGLVVAVAGCTPNDGSVPRHWLEGSVGEVMDLGFDVVRVLTTDTDVAVSFVRVHPLGSDADAGVGMAAANEDTVFKLAVKLWGDALPTKQHVDLTEQDKAGLQRATCSRDVLNDPRRDFPKLMHGFLQLDQAVAPGAAVHGLFYVTFEDGIEVASGRTVFSTSFDAKVAQ